MGVCRAFVDSAGGLILTGANTVRANGNPVARIGSLVMGHGKNEHSSAIIIGGSASVRVEGIGAATSGISRASCGHVVTSSGNVNAGG